MKMVDGSTQEDAEPDEEEEKTEDLAAQQDLGDGVRVTAGLLEHGDAFWEVNCC
jgi:hypothetical protein